MLNCALAHPSDRARRWRCATAVAVWIGFGLPAIASAAAPDTSLTPAQLDDSDTAITMLKTANSYAGQRQYDQALGLYQQVLKQFPNRVYPFPDEMSEMTGVERFVSVRDYCHFRIARLGSKGVARYRRYVDPLAEHLYTQAAKDRDARQLRRIADEALCSSWADDALDLLAEIALERGRFFEAVSYWQLLLDSCPKPSVNVTFVQAKICLARIYAGQTAPARRALKELTAEHPDAEATIGGKRVKLATFLADALARHTKVDPRVSLGMVDWTTFGGDPTRTRSLPRTVTAGQKQWSYKIASAAPKPGNVRPGRRPGFNPRVRRPVPRQTDPWPQSKPIIYRQQVIIPTAKSIAAVDLLTGAVRWRTEPPQPVMPWDARRPGRPTPSQPSASTRFTVTIHRGVVYFVDGAPSLKQPRGFGIRRLPGAGGAGKPQRLIAVDSTTEGKLLWEVNARELLADKVGSPASFQGAPLADQGRLYVSMIAGTTEMPQVYLVCLDAATGRRQWFTFVCEAQSLSAGSGIDVGYAGLVTLAGQTLYHCTNLGVIAAVDVSRGRTKWLVRYPRKERNPWGTKAANRRMLTPCVVAEGQIVALPHDSPHILALNAHSGELSWKAPAEGLWHLIGAAGGRILATGDSAVAIDLASGRRAWRYPAGGAAKAEGYGRGVMAGSYLYWPTKDKVTVLDTRTGKPTGPQSFTLSGKVGDLLVAGDYLLSITPTEVTAYCQYSKIIERYRKEIAELGDSPLRRLQLARLAQKGGDMKLAIDNYERGYALTGESVLPGDKETRRDIAEAYHRLLITLGGKRAGASEWEIAQKRFERASQIAPGARTLLESLVGLGAVLAGKGELTASVDVYQRILVRDDLRDLSFQNRASVTVPAGILVANRIHQLIGKGGREIYATYDAAAAKLLAAARLTPDPRGLKVLLAKYPNARSTGQAMKLLALRHTAAKDYDAAARVYRHFLVQHPDSPEVPQVLVELARVYEQTGLWESSRSVLNRLQRKFANATVTFNEVDVKVADLVNGRLALAQYSKHAGGGTPWQTRLPLYRAWQFKSNNISVHLREPEGRPPVGAAGVFMIHIDRNMQCRRIQDNETLWQRSKYLWKFKPEAQAVPLWERYHGNTLLVGSRVGLAALRLADGKAVWEELFAKKPPEGADGAPKAPGRRTERPWVQHYTMAGDLIICQRDASTLQAYDAKTGQLRWRQTLPSPLIPRRYADRQWLVVETTEPRRLQVLDPEQGRQLFRLELGARKLEEALVLDHDKLCLLLQTQRGAVVESYDMYTGAQVWSIPLPKPARPTAHISPKILAEGTALLALVDGTELMRLDAADGRTLWKQTISTLRIRSARHSIKIGPEQVYCATSGRVEARRLTDGTVYWTRLLRGDHSQWRLQRTSQYLVAHPSRGSSGSPLPVVFLEAGTGEPVQKLNFGATSARPQLALADGGLVVYFDGSFVGFRTQPTDADPSANAEEESKTSS